MIYWGPRKAGVFIGDLQLHGHQKGGCQQPQADQSYCRQQLGIPW